MEKGLIIFYAPQRKLRILLGTQSINLLYKDANKAVYQRKNEPPKKEGAGVRYMAPNRILYIQGYLPPPEQLRAANPQ